MTHDLKTSGKPIPMWNPTCTSDISVLMAMVSESVYKTFKMYVIQYV